MSIKNVIFDIGRVLIGYAKKQDFTLSPEVDSAEWGPLAKAPDLMYPDSPGNAQYGTYKVYCERKGK